MDDGPKTNVLWWAAPAAAILLLSLLAMFGGVEPPRVPPARSTFDASRDGVRACYYLLDGLGYDVVQSRRLSAGRVRWVLFPSTGEDDVARESDSSPRRQTRGRSPREDAEALDQWVRGGGTLLVADDSLEFAGSLGLRVVKELDMEAAVNLEGGRRPLALAPGRVWITPQDRPDRTWPESGDPLASIYRRGRGEIWIVQRPDIFRNERIRDADNALAICRLADATSRERAERIYFDEFFHGMRERTGPVQLLLQPPALWVTLQGLGMLALLLWRFLPRFGPFRDTLPTRRRSKEEFLDAMAYLLTRKGAHAEAFVVVRDGLSRDLERALGLPATTPVVELAAHAASRRPGLNEQALAGALQRKKPPPGNDGFIRAINELEHLRREFFHE